MSATRTFSAASGESFPPADQLRIHSQTVLLTDGIIGVNHVISMLRSRRYDVRSLTADLARDGHGNETKLRVDIAVCGGHETTLLGERLLRLPSVLDVQ